MGRQYETSSGLEQARRQVTRHRENTATPGDEQKLNIAVVFTSLGTTLAALEKAGTLASRLSARILLIVPQIVPYPLPLSEPPVSKEWNETRLHMITKLSPVQTLIRLYLCRDRAETLAAVLAPHSLVVIGARKHWWPTQESRLAKRLRRAGHEVILLEKE